MQNSETEKQVLIDRAERIVSNEVYTNCSYLITELVSNEKYMDELMEIMSTYPDNSEEIKELEEQVSDLESDRDAEIEEVSDTECADQFYPYYGGSEDEFLQLYVEITEALYESEIEELESEIENLESEQEYPDEALEHWIVSNWLAGKLKAKGQMVMDFNNLMIWGRTTSGQHIAMDCVIVSICEDLSNV